MFCTKCGREIKDGARFCTGCGAPIRAASSVTEAPSLRGSMRAQSASNGRGSQGGSEGGVPKALWYALGGVGVAAVVIAAAVLGYRAFHGDDAAAGATAERGTKQTLTVDDTETAASENEDSLIETETEDRAQAQPEEAAETATQDSTDPAQETREADPLFKELAKWEFYFSSGAGAWGTELEIHEDGSFNGVYSDSDMGDTGEGYSGGKQYYCSFSGQFAEPERVDEYTYSTRILEIRYEDEVGKEEIIDDVLYIYTDVYGLEDAEDILIYLPGKPLDELSEAFLSWMFLYDYDGDELPFCALNNAVNEEGFAGNKRKVSREEHSVGESAAVQDEGSIHTYEIVMEDISWTDAYYECLARGGYLVRINSPEEYEAVAAQIGSAGLENGMFWLGGCRSNENEYRWLYEDGSTSAEILNGKEYWLEGEPSFYDESTDAEETAVLMFHSSAAAGWVWNDVPDDVLSVAPFYAGKLGYICEYEN